MIDRFVKELIERLEEERGHICHYMPCNGCKYIGDCNDRDHAEDVALDKAIEIVSKLAEESNLTPCYFGSPCEYQNEDAKMPMEYWNNGWIPCSERLPSMEEVEEWAVFLATIRVHGKYDIMDFCLFGTDGKWLVSEGKEVIAWKRQMPYQPKEDKQK